MEHIHTTRVQEVFVSLQAQQNHQQLDGSQEKSVHATTSQLLDPEEAKSKWRTSATPAPDPPAVTTAYWPTPTTASVTTPFSKQSKLVK